MTRTWRTLASVPTPDGPLDLKQRGDEDFLITLRGRIVMTSSAHRSEDALAVLACEALAGRRAPRVLVSGLGMGFTLRATLDALGPDARVTVAELNASVAAWCRGPLAPLAREPLSDPRVTLVVDDVARVIARAAGGAVRERFDAIVLDMYEGPAGRVRLDDPIYGPAAVARTRHALTPGGVFAIWMEEVSPGFDRALDAAGFTTHKHRAGQGARVHRVYVCRAPEGASTTARAARGERVRR